VEQRCLDKNAKVFGENITFYLTNSFWGNVGDTHSRQIVEAFEILAFRSIKFDKAKNSVSRQFFQF